MAARISMTTGPSLQLGSSVKLLWVTFIPISNSERKGWTHRSKIFPVGVSNMFCYGLWNLDLQQFIICPKMFILRVWDVFTPYFNLGILYFGIGNM